MIRDQVAGFPLRVGERRFTDQVLIFLRSKIPVLRSPAWLKGQNIETRLIAKSFGSRPEGR